MKTRQGCAWPLHLPYSLTHFFRKFTRGRKVNRDTSGFYQEVDSWMHYRAKILDTGQVLAIYEDHRGSIPVCAAAHKYGIFVEPPTLLRLDAHTDFGDGKGGYDLAWKGDLHYLKLVCDQALRSDDGTWLADAEFSDMVANVGTWFLNPSYGAELNQKQTLTDRCGNSHATWFTESFDYFFTAFEAGEPWATEMAKGLWIHKVEDEILPYYKAEYWLDIDLDFCMDENGVWPQERFNEHFGADTPSGRFWRELVDSASLITISTEPHFTRGLANGAKILEMLRESCDLPEAFQW